MWVEEVKTKSGTIRYRYAERYTCPFSGKQKRVSCTLGSNSRQAYKIAQSELAEKIAKATSADNGVTMTLDALLTEFLNSKRAFRKLTTQQAQDHLHKNLIYWFPADILISNINTKILQQAIDGFAQKYSYNYTKAGLSVLRQAFKYARRMEYIRDISFFDNVEIQTPVMDVNKVKKAREKFLTKAELKKLLPLIAKESPHIALLCEFQALTGLRFGEMVALRDQDFDEAKAEIDVNATLMMIGSLRNPENRIPPKNVHSVRKVTLDQRAIDIIKHFQTANKARKLWKPKVEQTDYIFCSEGGIPYDHRHANSVLRKIEFPKHVSTHTFRHTHVSLLAEANVPLKAIMARVGHNEPRTTLAIYTHVTDDMQAQLNNAISNIGKTVSLK